MAMEFFEEFKTKTGKERFYAAAVTYAYYLRYCAL